MDGLNSSLHLKPRERAPGPSTWLAPALTLVALFFAAGSGVSQHPPRYYPQWAATFFAGAGAIGVALWCSAARPALGVRFVQGGAIFLSLLAWLVPITSHFRSFHDFPWGEMLALGVPVAALGWRCGQRWLPLAALAGAVFWVVSTSRPPTLALPATVRSGGLALTLQSVEGRLVNFCLDPRANLAQFDLENIQVDGKVPPGLEIAIWGPYRFDAGKPPRFSVRSFPPRWSRSMDLTVTIPSWPKKAAAQVTIPVPPRGRSATGASAAGSGMNLMVGRAQWSETTTRYPSEPCLATDITYSGLGYSGCTGKELRATNDRGETVPITWSSVTGNATGATIDAQVYGIPEGSRRITISLYSEAQRRASQRVFHFRGVPNRTANLGADDPFISR